MHLTSDTEWTFSYTLGGAANNVVIDSAGPGAITGNAAANRLTGNDGDDFLYGLGGDDVLAGAGGKNRLDGGDGKDIAIINVASGSAAITPTSSGLIVKTANATDTLVAVETIRFADRDVSTSDYVIQSTSGNEDLIGTRSADWLFGYAGDDRLDGLAGADHMIGGAGDDLYFVDDAGDRVTEAFKGGNDTVVTSVSYTTPENVETLRLAAGANGTLVAGDSGTRLIGNQRANALQGASADDVLDGRGGGDTMTGAEGDDTYLVDNANDVVVEKISGGVDVIRTMINYALPTNVEVLSVDPAMVPR